MNAKKRNRRIVTISIVVAIIAVVAVLVLVVEASNQDPLASYIGQPVSSSIMQQLTGVSDSTLSTVGLPSSVNPPLAPTTPGTPLTSGGKPVVLYVGGEFCPYCAVERWSIIIALSHFGNFSGLEYMQSSSYDVNANTPTFTFVDASYTSSYINFTAREELDRNTATLQTLNSVQSSIYSQYGTCASTGGAGGIPFVDIANAYVVNCGAQFNLPQIAGDNWTQVASQLNSPGTTVAQDMDGAANTLITAICKVDGEQPASVCTQSFADVTLADATIAAAASASGQQNLALLPQLREESRWVT
jgi:hypothetical protein